MLIRILPGMIMENDRHQTGDRRFLSRRFSRRSSRIVPSYRSRRKTKITEKSLAPNKKIVRIRVGFVIIRSRFFSEISVTILRNVMDPQNMGRISTPKTGRISVPRDKKRSFLSAEDK